MPSASEITKKAKSNLAFALACLPKQRRQDMVTFYAFCRVVDDIADEPILPVAERHRQLDQWSEAIRGHFSNESSSLHKETFALISRYDINPDHLTQIIEGCRSDIDSNPRFGSWEELEKYTYRVACCVGLVSIKIFGCNNPKSEIYAVKLGHALQLTNILRDVGHDLDHGNRIYLPHTEMIRFQYSERDLVGKVHDGRFVAMMEYHAQHAEYLFQEAVDHLTAEDAKALKPAESMRKIYTSILHKMRKDNFQVFSKTYKLSKLKKLYYLFS